MDENAYKSWIVEELDSLYNVILYLAKSSWKKSFYYKYN